MNRCVTDTVWRVCDPYTSMHRRCYHGKHWVAFKHVPVSVVTLSFFFPKPNPALLRETGTEMKEREMRGMLRGIRIMKEDVF